MTLAIQTITVTSPFLVLIATLLALFRRIRHAVKYNGSVNLALFFLMAIAAFYVYVLFFGDILVMFQPYVAAINFQLSLFLLAQVWSYRKQDKQIKEAEKMVQQAEEVSQFEEARLASLDYMRMTAQAAGVRGGLKASTLQGDVTEIKQHLEYQDELLVMILNNQKKDE
jgi:Ca2+/Na+ antiporter